jgi:hypothetical protein
MGNPQVARLKLGSRACIYPMVLRREPRLTPRVFRWATGIHSFMLRERIESPWRVAGSP